MHDLKACIVCLRTNVKICNIRLNQLRGDYNLISGLKTQNGDGLPEYVCMECFAYMGKFKKFREKCHKSHYLLQEILQKNKQITQHILNNLNLSNLHIGSSLSYLEPNQSRNSYEIIKFKWEKENRPYVEPLQHATVLQYSTYDDDTAFISPNPKSEPVLVNFANNEQNTDLISVPTFLDGQVLIEEIPIEGPDGDDYMNISDDGIDNDLHANGDTSKDMNDDVDGSNLDEEYAIMVPISNNESRAVIDVYKMYVQSGKIECNVCGKRYHNEKRLEIHMRMHDMHINGPYFCELCHFYYKTNFLLKTHITEKHMYKYICRKCPEVSFDRTSAKQHYIWTHLQKGSKKNSNWYDSRPKWLKKKCPNGQKNVLCMRPVKKAARIPIDYLKYSPISHEEQYALVLERKTTKNYIESPFKCEYCYRGFRELATYNKHMKKHDPKVSGEFQCDACKICCRDTRKMYKHMIQSHLFKYDCQLCSFKCTNRNQAKMHYRWHKDVTYSCPHCDKVYKKASTRLTHIRLKHPSTFICNLCGHSFVSENGLYCHKRMTHTKQEVEEDACAPADESLYCAECAMQFRDRGAFTTHLGASSKHCDKNLSCMKQKPDTVRKRRPRRHYSEVYNNGVATATRCEICDKLLVNDQQARKHYEAEHPGSDFRKRYMCDICGHATRQYSNLLVHMRTHTLEKPYACPHCERRFSMPSNRDRHLVVHTGEKRYECQHCHRRFSQSSAVKLHIQTVHLKIPYAPWDKNNRKRRKEADAVSAVVTAPLAIAPPPPKLAEAHDYLNAYINYNE